MYTIQDIQHKLNEFWSKNNCLILHSYDQHVGAGTLHPATILGCIVKNNWNIAYSQYSRRPSDNRYGKHPNRLGHYFQYQVILKPAPENIQDLCLESMNEIGLSMNDHDIRFIEDDWANPTVGAAGLGWEVWCDGMEVLQYTYMQQIGGIDIFPTPGELTFGIERMAMYIQNKSNIMDVMWNDTYCYGDIYQEHEKQYGQMYKFACDKELYLSQFQDCENRATNLLQQNLFYPAYDEALKASHILNLLDAGGTLSTTERASYILRVRNITKSVCEKAYEFSISEISNPK